MIVREPLVSEDNLLGDTEEDGRRIDTALALGVRAALRRHKQNRQAIVVWEDGKVKWIPAEEIDVPDDDSDLLRDLHTNGDAAPPTA
ncbi:MAG: hypothetical protein SFU56_15490 [Capsulimonadales bacterium]|nr:hypothetical protein [Capsulimonadales bacterium]